MHPDDRGVWLEPAWTRCAVDPIPVLRAVRSCHTTEEFVAGAVPQLGEHVLILGELAKRCADERPDCHIQPSSGV